MKRFFTLLIVLAACSPKVQPQTRKRLNPPGLRQNPIRMVITPVSGMRLKSGNSNYIQAAKKSALDDLISDIKVTGFQYLNPKPARSRSQVFHRTVRTDHQNELLPTRLKNLNSLMHGKIASNYWVYYRLSISRYRQIKEEQKRNATLLSNGLPTESTRCGSCR